MSTIRPSTLAMLDPCVGISSDRGKSAKPNQDRARAFVGRGGEGTVLVLADGMGGHAAGEIASDIATTTIVEAFETRGFTDPQRVLEEAFAEVNLAIIRDAQTSEERKGMGTTLVTVVLCQNQLFYAHVGDSRATLFRGDYCRRLTKDHLRIVETDNFPENKAKGHPRSNILSRAMGIREVVEPSFGTIAAEEGDRILLCSDGISEFVHEDELAEFLFTKEPATAAETVTKRAIAQGSHDHCTAVVGRIIKF